MFYSLEESSDSTPYSAMKNVFYFAVVTPKTAKINIGITVLLPGFLSINMRNVYWLVVAPITIRRDRLQLPSTLHIWLRLQSGLDISRHQLGCRNAPTRLPKVSNNFGHHKFKYHTFLPGIVFTNMRKIYWLVVAPITIRRDRLRLPSAQHIRLRLQSGLDISRHQLNC